jgi:hypothetical protein
MQSVKQILVWQGVLLSEAEGGGGSQMAQAQSLTSEEEAQLRDAVRSIPELEETLQ